MLDPKKLQDSISGQVITDREILDFYSTDASFFIIRPKMVVIPENKQDVIQTVRFARRHKIPITPRGAGTGLVGGALGNGIILDMRKLDSISIKKNYAIVQAGTLKGRLDMELKKRGMFFPVNPSIGPYCSVGGMIANNSSGSRSVKYGSMIDNVLELEYIDSNGKVICLPKNSKISKKIMHYTRKIIKDDFPRVSKNSCGYRLDKVSSKMDSHKLLVGSEGTLGIIIWAKLAIRRIPKNRTLIVLEYINLKNTTIDISLILKTNPAAVEIVDKNTLKHINFHFSKDTQYLLLVEYDTKSKIPDLQTRTHVVKKNSDIDIWWKYRDLALYHSLRAIPQKNRIPNIIEDSAVPVDKLDEFFNLIKFITEKYSCQATMYGHAGNGNIHVRLASKNISKEKIRSISREFFENIIAMGGTITAEHGDGIARTKFVRQQYGKKNYQIFKKIKQDFDKENILNPGKVISSIKSPKSNQN